jgi:hypothetical protein
MYQAMRLPGVSRQTVLQRVKRGELDAIHVMRGKKVRQTIRLGGNMKTLAYPISWRPLPIPIN